MQARLLATLVAATLAATSVAQTAIWAPNGFAATAGNSNNGFPWNWGATPIHYLQTYGAANFTAQSVTGAVQISRLRFRAAVTTGSWAGGSFPSVVLNMSTAALPYSSISTTFASNHGANLTNVYSGPVTVLPGTGSSPGPVYVDITLSTPFVYDPTAGDLCLEVVQNGNLSGGSTQCDAVQGPGSPAQSRRLYNIGSASATTGSVDGFDYGLITEFTYLPATGSIAIASTYGTGCYQRAASFYESFGTSAAFDLSNTALTMIYNGSNGYVVLPGITTFVTPSPSATTVANGDDVEQTVTLGSALPVVGGSTSALTICSNGYVSTASGNGTGFTPSSGAFLGFPQTCWANWHDFNPLSGGSIKFEEVGSISYVTWLGVADFSGGGFSTFQYQFDRGNGTVHMVWQSMSALGGTGYVTGFHAGGSTNDPGNRDISATLAATFTTGPDQAPLTLASSARPIIGTTINRVTSNIPSGSPIGVNILSFTQYNPGLDLTSIGMPGCRQFVGLDSTSVFLVSGPSNSSPLGIPNNAGLAGLRVYGQSATFSTGLNPLGVVSSNGLTLVLGTL